MDQTPKFIRKENLAGQHDSKSINLKFNSLSPTFQAAIEFGLAHARVGNFDSCFSVESLDKLQPEQRKQLSSLCADLNLSSDTTKEPEKATIESIANIFK